MNYLQLSPTIFFSQFYFSHFILINSSDPKKQSHTMVYNAPPQGQGFPRPNLGWKQGIGKKCKQHTQNSRKHFPTTNFTTFPDHADMESTLLWLMSAKERFDLVVDKVTQDWLKIKGKWEEELWDANAFGEEMMEFQESIIKKHNVKLTFNKYDDTFKCPSLDDFDYRLWMVVWDSKWTTSHITQLTKKNHICFTHDQVAELETKVKHDLLMGLPTQHISWAVGATEISFMAYETETQRIHTDHSLIVAQPEGEDPECDYPTNFEASMFYGTFIYCFKCLDVCDLRHGPQLVREPELTDDKRDKPGTKGRMHHTLQQGFCCAFGPNVHHGGGINPFPFVRLHVHLDLKDESKIQDQLGVKVVPKPKKRKRKGNTKFTHVKKKKAPPPDSPLAGAIGDRPRNMLIFTKEEASPNCHTKRMRKKRDGRGGFIKDPLFVCDPKCNYYSKEEKNKHREWLHSEEDPISPIGLTLPSHKETAKKTNLKAPPVHPSPPSGGALEEEDDTKPPAV